MAHRMVDESAFESSGIRNRLRAIPAIGEALYRLSAVPDPFYGANAAAREELAQGAGPRVATLDRSA